MKKKYILIFAIIILAVLGLVAYRYNQQPDGSTTESRVEILRGTPKGTEWNIAQEQEINGYLLSSIYGEKQSGIAVFEPIGNDKYKLISREWRDSDDIVISGFIVDREWYDIVWFNGAATSYAELTYTIDGKQEKPLVFDTSDMKIICTKAPAKDYSLEVKYYDAVGNVYE